MAVYTEAAEQLKLPRGEKALREQNEPAFIEWGHGKQGAGLGSNTAKPEKGGFFG